MLVKCIHEMNARLRFSASNYGKFLDLFYCAIKDNSVYLEKIFSELNKKQFDQEVATWC